jgi:hypothetical protein
MTNLIFRPLALCVMLAVASCSDSSTKIDHESADHHDMDTAVAAEPVDTVKGEMNDTTKFKFDFAMANIPSPATAVQDLVNYNVQYDNTILNAPGKLSKYSSEFQKAVNLGVYNIDMAYAMVNEKGQDVLLYMKTVLSLSDALGIKGAVNTMVGKRAEKNLNNRDSLFRILDEIFVKSDSYLRTNERVYTAALIFTGSWIESLHLNSVIAEKAIGEANKMAARQDLWEQRFYLGNLLNLLNDYKEKAEINDLLAKLTVIHKEITAIKKAADITDKKFAEIAAKLAEARAGVTM